MRRSSETITTGGTPSDSNNNDVATDTNANSDRGSVRRRRQLLKEQQHTLCNIGLEQPQNQVLVRVQLQIGGGSSRPSIDQSIYSTGK